MINSHQEGLISKLVGIQKENRLNAEVEKKLRIGIIVDALSVSSDIYDFVDWTIDQHTIEVSLIINQGIAPKGIFAKLMNISWKYGLINTLSILCSSVIRKSESLLFKHINQFYYKNKVIENYFRQKNLSDFDIEELKLSPIISISGFIHKFTDIQIKKIKDENLDLLIRFGSGILKGDILKCTPLGIISFHHGDHEINRGGPAGFWEILYRQNKTGFIIQQLTDELDGGNILFKGAFSTKPFFVQNQAYLYKKSYFYLKLLIAKLSIDRSLIFISDQKPYSFPLFKNPTMSEQLKYLIYVFNFCFAKVFFRIINRPWKWHVAIIDSRWQNSKLWKGKIVAAPVNHYFADPFLISHKDNDYCFVEDFDINLKKGKISVGLISKNEWQYLGCALEEDFHLSFPYVFETGGSHYMIPETSEDRSIRLYECEDFPLKWKIKSILMRNVEASDSLVFERDNLWWLLTSIDPVNAGDCSSELFLFYSDNLFSENWKPHPLNPIIIDPGTGRNGGILRDECGNIYRVAQNYGFNMYGQSASIFKISKLTISNYEEEIFSNITPNYFKFINGTHHMHSTGNLTAFDFVARGRFD